MGPVVVVVVLVLVVLFKTFTQIFIYCSGHGKGGKVLGKAMWESGRDPTLKKVLYAKSVPMSDRSWRRVKTFFGVGSLNIKGSNPEESFIREVRT